MYADIFNSPDFFLVHIRLYFKLKKRHRTYISSLINLCYHTNSAFIIVLIRAHQTRRTKKKRKRKESQARKRDTQGELVY